MTRLESYLERMLRSRSDASRATSAFLLKEGNEDEDEEEEEEEDDDDR